MSEISNTSKPVSDTMALSDPLRPILFTRPYHCDALGYVGSCNISDVETTINYVSGVYII